jgi:hypothetical protein
VKTFKDGVRRCEFEWRNAARFRPITHVCALEHEHLNRHVCRCGKSKVERKRSKKEKQQ